jgi:hypothetical protein
MPAGNTTLRRGKIRREDTDLHTTRLVGAGWTWDCSCGEKGSWHSNRDQALESARVHRIFTHGQR